MNFQRGDVVQRNGLKRIGVVLGEDTIGKLFGTTEFAVKWFLEHGEVVDFEGTTPIESLTKIDGYEMEAALALGDTAKALELYRAEQKRMDGWQQHFQPLIDQYGAAEIAWIAGSIAAMVATGQFTPEDAIRHWAKPQAVVSNSSFVVMADQFDQRVAQIMREGVRAPNPPDWWISGMKLVDARQRFDQYTGGLTDGEWQEILDHCHNVTAEEASLDVYWLELSALEEQAQMLGHKDAVLKLIRKAKSNE